MLHAEAMIGARHRVLMQMSKNGFYYALDAGTGKLLRVVDQRHG